MPTSSKSFTKSFNQPDETRPFKAHGHLDVLSFGKDLIIGRAVFEPGWKWSSDVKPIANTDTCEDSHSGYCISGSITIRMNSGEQFTIRAGEGFHIPPGHDAWVEGNEPCVLIDVTGYKEYAKKAA